MSTPTADEIEEARLALAETWRLRLVEASRDFPGFREITEADDLPITGLMVALIVQAVNGTGIAYHLGTNPNEAARIAALPPAGQAFELGRLSAELPIPKSRLH